jgi:hypothetical protein
MKATLEQRRQSRGSAHGVWKLEISKPVTGIRHVGFVLADLLVLFGAIEFLMPMRTAVQIGADEGFELAKATSWLHGFKLYSEIWNDQPPLHTFIITQALQHLSHQVLVPRLITVFFGAVLVVGFFFIVARFSGAFSAAVAALLLLASPGFVELTSSCMLEIPSFSCAIVALSLLSVRFRLAALRWTTKAVAGLIFAAGLEMKLLPAYLLPVAVLLILAPARLSVQPDRLGWRTFAGDLGVFGFFMVLGVIGIDLLVVNGAYLAHFGQSWRAHFIGPKSLDTGSPDEHRFDWGILLKNWDTSVPALIGIGVCARELIRGRISQSSTAHKISKPGNTKSASPSTASTNGLSYLFADFGYFIPLSWLLLSLIIFVSHKPWWAYYYVHTALPLCWLAATGIVSLSRMRAGHLSRARFGSHRFWIFAVAMFVLCSASWAGARVYFEIRDARALPKTFSTPVISRIARLKPNVHFMFTDESVYSFHTDIPMPPDLAVVSLKRFWAGDITKERVIDDMASARPEVILLANNSKPVLFQDFLETNYRLTYVDDRHRLFVARKEARVNR